MPWKCLVPDLPHIYCTGLEGLLGRAVRVQPLGS